MIKQRLPRFVVDDKNKNKIVVGFAVKSANNFSNYSMMIGDHKLF